MPNIGDVVNVAGIDWIVLDKNESAVLCLTKDFINEPAIFDYFSNNYAESEIRDKLNNSFLQQITDAVGEDALFNVEIDLMTEDGLRDYGCVVDKVGLLTCNMYRRYNYVIERFERNRWWLATAHSTPHRDDYTYVHYVGIDNSIYRNDCDTLRAVRPFCMFKATIFES